MSNCCQAVQHQWYPDPDIPGQFNLGCANCGQMWGPVSAQPVTPPAAPPPYIQPMLPFEEQAIGKLNALMTAFEVEDNYPGPISGVDQEGGGVYEVSWDNLEAVVTNSTKKSWSKSAIVSEMGRLLTEARAVELDPEPAPDSTEVDPADEGGIL